MTGDTRPVSIGVKFELNDDYEHTEKNNNLKPWSRPASAISGRSKSSVSTAKNEVRQKPSSRPYSSPVSRSKGLVSSLFMNTQSKRPVSSKERRAQLLEESPIARYVRGMVAEKEVIELKTNEERLMEIKRVSDEVEVDVKKLYQVTEAFMQQNHLLPTKYNIMKDIMEEIYSEPESQRSDFVSVLKLKGDGSDAKNLWTETDEKIESSTISEFMNKNENTVKNVTHSKNQPRQEQLLEENPKTSPLGLHQSFMQTISKCISRPVTPKLRYVKNSVRPKSAGVVYIDTHLHAPAGGHTTSSMLKERPKSAPSTQSNNSVIAKPTITPSTKGQKLPNKILIRSQSTTSTRAAVSHPASTIALNTAQDRVVKTYFSQKTLQSSPNVDTSHYRLIQFHVPPDVEPWDIGSFSVTRFIQDYSKIVQESERKNWNIKQHGTEPQRRKTIVPSNLLTQPNGIMPTHDVLVSAEDRQFLMSLRKPPSDRSSTDRKKIYTGMKAMPAFGKINDFVLSELSGVVTWAHYEPNRVVFQQGR
jgi:hypothetical protein